MSPNYSILLYNPSYEEYQDHIKRWLHEGVKVLYFGSTLHVSQLRNTYPDFIQAFLLQVYPVDSIIQEDDTVTIEDNNLHSFYIIDGIDAQNHLPALEVICPTFNIAQYRVEHNQVEQHIIVQASAGTGKTTVMVDRILYLMHTIPDLKMSEIHMITFTNEATNSMNLRLQQVLLTRYQLTKHPRYRRLLEEQSQMYISTIHSFGFHLLREFGIDAGFTRHLHIRDLQEVKKSILADSMEEMLSNQPKGMNLKDWTIPMCQMRDSLLLYWNTLISKGISYKDVLSLIWSKVTAQVTVVQALFPALIQESDQRYQAVKRQDDVVSVSDIMRDLDKVLIANPLPPTDVRMRYLFVDEFQDSDLSQIRVMITCLQELGARLIVVGDIKQSIYRFRGATEKAFVILEELLDQLLSEGELAQHELRMNYRTCANLLTSLHTLFDKWSAMGLLVYKEPVIPMNHKQGRFELIDGDLNQQKEEMIIAGVAKRELAHMSRIMDERVKANQTMKDTNRVVFLTRTNQELKQLDELFKSQKIPAVILMDGAFYRSEAVQDFIILLRSFLYDSEAHYIYQYLLSPYAGETSWMDPKMLEQFKHHPEALTSYLGSRLEETNWVEYHKELRLFPVLSVLNRIIEREPLLDRYVSRLKARVPASRLVEEDCISEIRMQAMQYMANITYLMEILTREFEEDVVSLHGIYEFLTYQAQYNHTESEPQLKLHADYRSILCMTVHKSKGLEFDTVVIPYTGRNFPESYRTELLMDDETKEVGWNIDRRLKRSVRNPFYIKRKASETLEVREEETRILYVATTRAIHRMIAVIHPPEDTENWAYLLDG